VSDNKQPAEELDEAGSEVAIQPIKWDGERIDASDALRERGAAYGMYVNTMRALPDIRDGLKNVQRRIIFSMASNNQVFSRSTTKCARIVGTTMGLYHPHGDSSIYDALVRLGQPFTVNATLIAPQGNFGSVDGDPAAAMRYTEAKLSKISSEWRQDTRPEIVPYRPNFDESANEPIVLPISFPVLLVNGSQGIGWSLACDVPPHNLGEAIDAALLIAENPQASLQQILKKMPAPDYPSGGSLIADSLAEAYSSGRGSFRLQGKYEIGQAGSSQAVTITELPYQVGPSQVFQEIIDGAKNEKITEITEKPVNLTSKKGTRLIVKLKRGGNLQALIAQLIKYTSLQTSQKINFTVLKDGNPCTVDLPELLRCFVDFRVLVVTKRLEHERDVLLKELRRLSALRSALDVIQKVIQIIREAKDDQQARDKLKAAVKVKPYGKAKLEQIDDEQAENILSMQLRRLNKLNRFQLDDEIQQKTGRCQEIDKILADSNAVTEIVKDELKAVKKEYAHPRLTQLSTNSGDLVDQGGSADPVPEAPVVIWSTRSGKGMAISPDHKSKHAPLLIANDDRIAGRLECKTTDALLCFSASSGSAYRVRVAELGVEIKKSRGQALCSIDKSDRLAGIVVADAQPFLAMITEGGQVKRIASEVLKGAHSGGVQAINLGDDKLLAVLPHSDGAELMVVSQQGRVLRISLDALRPVKSGAAGPVKLIKLADGDRVASACLTGGQSLAVFHKSGMAKQVPLADIPLKGRGGGGVALSSPDKPSRTPAGPVVLISIISASDFEVVLTDGQIISVFPAEGTRASVAKACILDPAALLF